MFHCKLIPPSFFVGYCFDYYLRDSNEQNDDVVAIEEKVCDPGEQGKAEVHEGLF